MIGCKVCRKEVGANPPVKICPYCGNEMYYIPLGAINFIGEACFNIIKVIGIIIAAIIAFGIIASI